MVLVRVYCGLACVDEAGTTPAPGSLTVAVVDDAGRLLDLCELTDDAAGFSYLTALLAERGSGPYSVAIAADRADLLVPTLLGTAGWPLSFADRPATDEFAERYVNDMFDEHASTMTQRRATGLARALQAAAISASLQPPTPDLAGIKPLLAAHGALAAGRQSAATGLREVLRELYPAALRAYPDPSAPISLAVIDALPEPGRLSAVVSRRATDEISSKLAETGAGDVASISEAITSLRVAIAETPRRGGLGRALTSTAAEAVRHSVAAVRAYDAAAEALTEAIAKHVARNIPNNASVSPSYQAGHTSAPPLPRRRSDPRPTPPVPVAPPPVAPSPVAPPPIAPPATSSPPAASGRPVSSPPPPPPGIAPISPPRPPRPPQPAAQQRPGPPPGSRADWPTSPPPDDWAVTASDDRIAPPWRSADLQPPEPPPLRLVEPTLPEELREDLGYSDPGGPADLAYPDSPEPPPLRLVEPTSSGAPRSVPPVSADASDDDLLIFTQTRSAWFTGSHDGETDWSSVMDSGWQAAEQAANPAVGERTGAGLPRRVPHANLVPGSPPRATDRPLRIVRNPRTIAEHTSGYFSGWRRGQEIGGFPLGGRPGRQAAGAWDFSREEDREYGT